VAVLALGQEWPAARRPRIPSVQEPAIGVDRRAWVLSCAAGGVGPVFWSLSGSFPGVYPSWCVRLAVFTPGERAMACGVGADLWHPADDPGL
jgi:hypothetical protein